MQPTFFVAKRRVLDPAIFIGIAKMSKGQKN
jgi:hypothetical protein